jgi:hypothetical protein
MFFLLIILAPPADCVLKGRNQQDTAASLNKNQECRGFRVSTRT